MWDILQENLSDLFRKPNVYNKIKIGIEGRVLL